MTHSIVVEDVVAQLGVEIIEDALTAAVGRRALRAARRGARGAGGGGGGHYQERYWIRDRLGRWVKYIGPKSKPQWSKDSSGREVPDFPVLRVFKRSTDTKPQKYAARIASERYDDDTVLLELARSVQDLGRGEDPEWSDGDSISRVIPDAVPTGGSVFVRVPMDNILIPEEEAARHGGRATLQRERARRRAQLRRAGGRASLSQPSERARRADIDALDTGEGPENPIADWTPDRLREFLRNTMVPDGRGGQVALADLPLSAQDDQLEELFGVPRGSILQKLYGGEGPTERAEMPRADIDALGAGEGQGNPIADWTPDQLREFLRNTMVPDGMGGEVALADLPLSAQDDQLEELFGVPRGSILQKLYGEEPIDLPDEDIDSEDGDNWSLNDVNYLEDQRYPELAGDQDRMRQAYDEGIALVDAFLADHPGDRMAESVRATLVYNRDNGLLDIDLDLEAMADYSRHMGDSNISRAFMDASANLDEARRNLLRAWEAQPIDLSDEDFDDYKEINYLEDSSHPELADEQEQARQVYEEGFALIDAFKEKFPEMKAVVSRYERDLRWARDAGFIGDDNYLYDLADYADELGDKDLTRALLDAAYNLDDALKDLAVAWDAAEARRVAEAPPLDEELQRLRNRLLGIREGGESDSGIDALEPSRPPVQLPEYRNREPEFRGAPKRTAPQVSPDHPLAGMTPDEIQDYMATTWVPANNGRSVRLADMPRSMQAELMEKAFGAPRAETEQLLQGVPVARSRVIPASPVEETLKGLKGKSFGVDPLDSAPGRGGGFSGEDYEAAERVLRGMIENRTNAGLADEVTDGYTGPGEEFLDRMEREGLLAFQEDGLEWAPGPNAEAFLNGEEYTPPKASQYSGMPDFDDWADDVGDALATLHRGANGLPSLEFAFNVGMNKFNAFREAVEVSGRGDQELQETLRHLKDTADRMRIDPLVRSLTEALDHVVEELDWAAGSDRPGEHPSDVFDARDLLDPSDYEAMVAELDADIDRIAAMDSVPAAAAELPLWQDLGFDADSLAGWEAPDELDPGFIVNGDWSLEQSLARPGSLTLRRDGDGEDAPKSWSFDEADPDLPRRVADAMAGIAPSDLADRLDGSDAWIDALDTADAGVGVETVGAPVPVKRYKPGAHRRDRRGGHMRGWLVRPYGHRERDQRSTREREALEEALNEGAVRGQGPREVDVRDVLNGALDRLSEEAYYVEDDFWQPYGWDLETLEFDKPLRVPTPEESNFMDALNGLRRDFQRRLDRGDVDADDLMDYRDELRSLADEFGGMPEAAVFREIADEADIVLRDADVSDAGIDALDTADGGGPKPVGRYKPGEERGGAQGSRFRNPLKARQQRRKAEAEAVRDQEAGGGVAVPAGAGRRAVRDAVAAAGGSPQQVAAVDTALSPDDLVEAIVDHGTPVESINIPGVQVGGSGGGLRHQLRDALLEAGVFDGFSEPERAAILDQGEWDAAKGRFTAFERWKSMSPLEQLDEIFAIIDGDAAPHLRSSFVGGPGTDGGWLNIMPKKRPISPRWFTAGSIPPEITSRRKFMEWGMRNWDSLTPAGQEALFGYIYHGFGEFMGASALTEAGSEAEAWHLHLSDRFEALSARLMEDTAGLPKNQRLAPGKSAKEVSDNAEQRLEAMKQIMQHQGRPGGYTYGGDLADSLSYRSHVKELVNIAGFMGLEQVGDRWVRSRTKMPQFHEIFVDAFGNDDDRLRDYLKLADDYASFLNEIHDGAASNPHREELLNRMFSRLSFLTQATREKEFVDAAGRAKSNADLFDGLRDRLFEIRNDVRGLPVHDRSWDTLSDGQLIAARNALQRFAGRGSVHGRDMSNAALALRDAVEASELPDEGSRAAARFAALGRARFLLRGAQIQGTEPLMDLLGVEWSPLNLVPLDDPVFRLADENLGPRRSGPRGQAWSGGDLDTLTEMAAELDQEAFGRRGKAPELQRNAAGLLDAAVKAYNAGDYGAFEAILETAVSRLSQLGDEERFTKLFGLRDSHWGSHQWDAEIKSLEQWYTSRGLEVPKRGAKNQWIRSQPRGRSVTREEQQYQNARGLIAEAMSRDPGTPQQRRMLATALWSLNQIEMTRPVEADSDEAAAFRRKFPMLAGLREALAPWDPNADERQALGSGRKPAPRTGATDTRVKRSQEVLRELLAMANGGALNRQELITRFGVSPGQLDEILRPLLNAGLIDVSWSSDSDSDYGSHVVGRGERWPSSPLPGEPEPPKGRKRNQPSTVTADNLALEAWIEYNERLRKGRPVVASARVWPITDPRVVRVDPGNGPESVEYGLVGAVAGSVNPRVAVRWDVLSDEWVLTTIPIGSWRGFGDRPAGSGVVTRRYRSVPGVLADLSLLADVNRVPLVRRAA